MERPISSALCPICNSDIPLKDMNNHIDICLAASGDAASSCDDSQSNSKQKVFSTPLSRSRKRSSSSPTNSSSSTSVKQSVLAFGRSSSNVHEDSPPQKSRKLDAKLSGAHGSCSTSAQPRPAGEGHKSSVTVQVDSKKLETSSNVVAKLNAPLAEVMRPSCMEDFVGQGSIVGKNSILNSILKSGEVPSLIFWGPPGCGKTTLVRIIAKIVNEKDGTRFTQLSATTSGIADVKEAVKVAKNHRIMFKKKTLLFIDEIHRFNKLQQDTFLPHVEDGTVTLLGATTETPSFQLNSALLSRCRVIVLEKLEALEIERILRRALLKLGVAEWNAAALASSTSQGSSHAVSQLYIESDALKALSQFCDGDARSALNGLQLAVQARRSRMTTEKPSTGRSGTKHQHQGIQTQPAQNVTMRPAAQGSCSEALDESGHYTSAGHELHLDTSSTNSRNEQRFSSGQQNKSGKSDQSSDHVDSEGTQKPVGLVTVEDVKESLQRTHLLYDRAGEEHYNCISALHKSMRGSDANGALYWLARMLCAGEDPIYVARRVVRFASEDIGLADPNALPQAVAAFQACKFIGMPECEVLITIVPSLILVAAAIIGKSWRDQKDWE